MEQNSKLQQFIEAETDAIHATVCVQYQLSHMNSVQLGAMLATCGRIRRHGNDFDKRVVEVLREQVLLALQVKTSISLDTRTASV